MALRSPAALPDRPAVRAFGSLFVLLLASALLNFLVAGGFDAAADAAEAALWPRLVGAVVYAALGLSALAATYAAVRHRRANAGGLERHELVQLGGASALVLFAGAYWLHGAATLPVFPGDVVSALLAAAVALVLPALVYARLRGIDVGLGLPGRGIAPLAGVTALVSALVGLASLVALATAGDPTIPVLPSGSAGLRRLGPRLAVGPLLWNAVLPSALVGFGTGVLYNGVVQAEFRGRAGPAGAVAAVAVLVGAQRWVFAEVGRSAGAAAIILATAATVALSLLAAAVAARGIRIAPKSLGADPLLAASVAVVGLAAALLAASLVRPYPAGFVASVLGYAGVAAVAGLGYERSRSAWVPGLAFAAYLLVTDWYVARSLLVALLP